MNLPEPRQEPVPETNNGSTWVRKRLKKIRWRVHATFPNIISSPHIEDRSYLEQLVQEQNEKTRVLESEELRLSTMWAVELFGPAEIESFYRQIRRLDWDKPRGHGLGKGVIDTVKEWRAYGLLGSFNIGVVHSTDHSHPHRNFFGPLPKDVEYLIIKIVQFSPEITCIVVGFVLKEKFSRTYERILCEDRKYEYRAIFGKFSYYTLGPENLKRESLDAERNSCRKKVISWFNKNFRGFFYSTNFGKILPTVELITCKNEIVLAQPSHLVSRNLWADLLVPHSWGDVWINSTHPGFRMRRSDGGDEIPLHSIVSLQTSSLSEQDFEMYGGVTPSAIVDFVHERIEDFLCQNAALNMLHGVGGMLKKSRETLTTNNGSYKKILKSIEEIKVFFGRSIGLPIVLSEIQEKAKNAHGYKWNGNEFLNEPWFASDAPVRLSENIRMYTLGLSKRVIADEIANREHFVQLVSILSTRESVKAQKRMEYISAIAIVVALGSLMTSLSPDSWITEAKAYIEKKSKDK